MPRGIFMGVKTGLLGWVFDVFGGGQDLSC